MDSESDINGEKYGNFKYTVFSYYSVENCIMLFDEFLLNIEPVV